MQIVITRDDLIERFGNGLDQLSKTGQLVMSRSLRQGSKLVKTIVLHELQEVTSVKKYGTVSKSSREYMQTPLSWVMTVRGKGLPASEFEYTVPKEGPMAANLAKVRWSPSKHWMLQRRTAEGRWQAITTETKPIVMQMWQKKLPFTRSRISEKDEAPLTQRVPGRRGWRMIYGPNLPNEVVMGTPAEAFQATAKKQVLDVIERNLLKILPTGGSAPTGSS